MYVSKCVNKTVAAILKFTPHLVQQKNTQTKKDNNIKHKQ